MATASVALLLWSGVRPPLAAQARATAQRAPRQTAGAGAAADARYGVLVLRDVSIATRDGISLATDVYLPSTDGRQADGQFPAILDRTPYNKSGIGPWPAYFVSRGYAVLVQDVRGRYASQGRWRPLVDDGPDGVDTAAWLGRQAWFSGKLGTVGTSYEGGTQHALAIAGAPYLAAMVPVDAMSNYGRYGVRHNGAFELRWFNWIFTLGNPTVGTSAQAAAARAAADPASRAALASLGLSIRDYVTHLPLRRGTTPLAFAPDYESWLIAALSHGDDDAFWKDSGASVVDHLGEYKDVPVLHVTGWYDSWGGPVANLSYVELSKAKKSPQRLVIGPWTHGGQQRSFAGEAEFGEEAALDMNAMRLRWFERWLKDAPRGTGTGSGAGSGAGAGAGGDDPPVRLFVMGDGVPPVPAKTPEGRLFVGGHWRDEQEWPLARAHATPYYLVAGGTLSPEAPAPDAAPTRFTFDPRHPVPTLGGNISSEGSLMFNGAVDQRCRKEFWLCTDTLPLSARNDVLVFQTPPLAADTEVTGRLVVKLFVSSSAPDTDFTAKLVDVYPPSADYPAGVDLNIADSIVRARYRDSLERATMMTAGQVYEVTIEMYPTSVVFRRGHRIRVDISSSNFPRFDVNPNTGEPLNDNRRWAIAENSVYHDRAHASRVVLPIIPRDAPHVR
jgi:putative CocE/NonD family hydrolase